MTTAYTSLLGLALPVTGELSGTWGDTVNTAITSLLDSAVAGTTSITVDADITLTTTTGASNEARQAIILWNPASGTTTRYITAPAQSKMYTVINASGGTQSIVIRGVGPTTGVTIAKGEAAMVAWNGSDFVKVSSSGGAITFTDLTVTGNTILGDAAADTLTVNATSTFASPVNFQGLVKLPSTGRSAAAALTTTAPAFLYGVASTYTDTTSSGTIGAMAPFYSIAQPTLATSNVTTYTNAATLYIANAPAAGGSATITNAYSLYVAAGNAYFADSVTLGSSSADTLAVNALVNTNLLFTDNTYDIGAAGATRPRNIYIGSDAVFGGSTGNTVKVAGYMGVGGISPDSRFGIYVNNTALTGSDVEGIISLPQANSANTSSIGGFRAQVGLAAGSYTTLEAWGYRVVNADKGAGVTLTTQYGLLIGDLTSGTYNYGITSNVSSGSNKYNLYMGGTARNYLAGQTAIGGNTNTYGYLEVTAVNTPLSLISSASGQGNMRFECTNVATAGVGYIGLNAFTNTVFGLGTPSGTNWPMIGVQNGSQIWYASTSGFAILTADSPKMALDVNGANVAPSTSGTGTNNGALRLRGSGTSVLLDMGIDGANSKAWMQSRDSASYATNYNLHLQPNGGVTLVGVGATSAGGVVNVRGSVPLYLDKTTTAEATVRYRTAQDSYSTEWGVGLRSTDINQFTFAFYNGSSWNNPVVTIDRSIGIGINRAPSVALDSYYASSVIGWQYAIGAAGNIQAGSGTLSYTGANPRGTALSVNANDGTNTTLPWGGGYDNIAVIGVTNSAVGGSYNSYGIGGYAVTNGGTAYGARFGADGTPNSVGNAVGVLINNVNAGSAGSAYGIYIGSTMAGTNQYAIYSDTANPSYHPGQFRIGSNATTTYWTGPVVPKLQVKGAVNAGPGSSGIGSSTATDGGSILRQTNWVGPNSSFSIDYSELGAIDNSGGMVMFTATNKVGGANGGVAVLLAIWTKHSGGNIAVTTVSSRTDGVATTISVSASGSSLVVTTNSNFYLAWTSVSAG